MVDEQSNEVLEAVLCQVILLVCPNIEILIILKAVFILVAVHLSKYPIVYNALAL
jgi:hypothetical protein